MENRLPDMERRYMGAPSNIKPQDRASALRFARKALDALDQVHSKWILWETTRPSATALKLVNDHLRLLVAMLGDSANDHYTVAHDLGVIAAQLVARNDVALLKPLMDIANAQQKILGPRN
jgi:hypothetical protein